MHLADLSLSGERKPWRGWGETGAITRDFNGLLGLKLLVGFVTLLGEVDKVIPQKAMRM